MIAEDFIKSFKALRQKMPKISQSGYQNQNCPYGNAIYNSKNCYMCFDVDSSENCLYCGMITRVRHSLDCEDTWDSELCYESLELYNCYSCGYSQFLRNCSDCSYCFDCLNCHNCFGCTGLRRANFQIFNQQYTPEEFKNRLSYFKKLSVKEIQSRVEALRKKCIHVATRQYHTENCFGDNIQNSKNCFYCFNGKGIYDGAYLHDVYYVYGERNEDIYDCFFSVDLFHCYECIQFGDGWNCNFCHYCEHLRDSEFCEACFNSKNLFGCTYINRREYLILNQPYGKEDWHKKTAELREKLAKSGNYKWQI